MKETIISSQRHLDADIVAVKRSAKDYSITLGKVIEIEGAEYRVLTDGHHSLAAAQLDGVEPVAHITTSTESDREGIEDVTAYLESHWMGDDWYNVMTGERV